MCGELIGPIHIFIMNLIEKFVLYEKCIVKCVCVLCMYYKAIFIDGYPFSLSLLIFISLLECRES